MGYRLICDGCEEGIPSGQEYNELSSELNSVYTMKVYHLHCMPFISLTLQVRDWVKMARRKALG